VEARDTKLGRRNHPHIPNVARSPGDLDDRGIVSGRRRGAGGGHPGGQGNAKAKPAHGRERLLRAIFGERARDG